jgi:type II secretory pathway component GspD/PulD (secretin)
MYASVAGDPRGSAGTGKGSRTGAQPLGAVVRIADEVNAREPRPAEDRQTKIYHLTFLKAGQIASVLMKTYLDPSRGFLRVAPVESSNSLLVYGEKAYLVQIDEALKQLDIPPSELPHGSRVILRRIKVRWGSSAAIVKLITEYWPRNGAELLQPDSTDNSILVRATEDEVNNIQMYVNVVDNPPPGN